MLSGHLCPIPFSFLRISTDHWPDTKNFKKPHKLVVGEDHHIFMISFFIPYYFILHFRPKLVESTNYSKALKKWLPLSTVLLPLKCNRSDGLLKEPMTEGGQVLLMEFKTVPKPILSFLKCFELIIVTA